ncbi:protein-methionine sulfoxide oxidase mical3a-like, partial [Hippocampus comes]|uniref:protein-methionine sulfoxide oxidase mical3a-like n=1 Tax=Hippocampus comes TaxID=109280 RepID=UPI00094E06A8
ASWALAWWSWRRGTPSPGTTCSTSGPSPSTTCAGWAPRSSTFCAGSIDHISIRQLQLVLLKVALLLGVQVHVNVEFKRVLEPPLDQRLRKVGWTLEAWPKSHLVNRLQFDVIVGADGRGNALPGFRRKEFRGKLAIAITANFKNRNTRAEAKVEEISGVASIFNQQFFQDLRRQTGIDLENLVYYKDDTHYFVMTAKKRCLLDKRVILQDFADSEPLLSRGNVDQRALQAFARAAADFSTKGQLPSLDFAINHRGRPDVAVFDFTSAHASENAAVVRIRRGYRLLVALVGDSLLEPFWPMGTGVARGFLAALDASWMVRRWCQGDLPLDILAERESVYRLLAQTTPENMQKNLSLYSLDPSSRYVNVCPSVTSDQVRHLIDTGEETQTADALEAPARTAESLSESNQLLAWCRQRTAGYRGVAVSDLTASWKSGAALCALLHSCRPQLLDFDSLDPAAEEENVRLAFDVCERELGISPLMTVEEMTSAGEPDALSMVVYLSQLYQVLRDAPPSLGSLSQSSEVRAALVTPASLLSRLGLSPSRRQRSKEKKRTRSERRRRDQRRSWDPAPDRVMAKAPGSRVRSVALLLQAKLRHGSPPPESRRTPAWRRDVGFDREVADGDDPTACVSDVCFFCHQKVYAMERLSAEGLFFHRSCFVCHACRGSLRIAAYRFHAASGKFSCAHHCESSTSASPSAKKPTKQLMTARDPTPARRTSCTSPLSSADSPVSVATECRRSSGFSVTRERIDLENDNAEAEETVEEISEEILTCFNLSTDNDDRTSGSEAPSETEAETWAPRTTEAAWERARRRRLRPMAGESDEEEDETASEEESSDDWGETPALLGTPSTASFVSEVDSASSACSPSRLENEAPPTRALVGKESSGAGEARPSPGRLPPREEHVEGAGPEEARERRRRLRAPRFWRARGGGAGALWKAVFSGNGPERRRADRRAEAPDVVRTMDESDASWSTARRRCSLEPRNDLRLETADLTAQLERLCVKEQDAAPHPPAYVPHALAFKPAFLSGKVETRARRPARRRRSPRLVLLSVLRLHRAQLIQRQLQLVEEEQRRLEARGVALERSLRGQQRGACGDESNGLMQLWFGLVQQKNILVRYESELMVFARELQLEDRQSRLQRELRESMTLDDRLKGERELARERAVLEEMLEVVERRRALVPLLEELRLQGRRQDRKLRAAVLGQARA